jgi:hypothetical protein
MTCISMDKKSYYLALSNINIMHMFDGLDNYAILLYGSYVRKIGLYLIIIYPALYSENPSIIGNNYVRADNSHLYLQKSYNI